MWDKIFEDSKQEIETHWKERKKDCLQGKSNTDVFLVAIDGMCGSGKSTLGRRLQEYFGCRLFHMDDYFLQPYQRTAERLLQPGGNVDYERFREEVLDHLEEKEGLWYQRFDCKSLTLVPAVKIPYHELVIVEGVYSCHPYFGDVHDLKFFLESSRKGQKERILQRSGPEKWKRFQQVWIPMEDEYFNVYQIRDKCKILKVD